MADLYARLAQASRPVEAHFFGFGEHGVGFALGDPLLGPWPSLLLSWMRTSGCSPSSRASPSGAASRWTASPCRGDRWSSPRCKATAAPAVIAYVFGTVALPGEFVVRAERGPMPGPLPRRGPPGRHALGQQRA